MKERRCVNCGAPLQPGASTCDACGTAWSPPPRKFKVPFAPSRIPPDPSGYKPPMPTGKPRKGGVLYIIGFVALAFFCAPIGIFFLWRWCPWSTQTKAVLTVIAVAVFAVPLLHSLYQIESNTIGGEGSSHKSDAPAFEDRETEEIDPKEIFLQMRDEGNGTIEERRAIWQEQYAGKWVLWPCNIEEGEYSDIRADIKCLRPSADSYQIEANFNPEYGETFESLYVGQQVVISARLWEYSALLDDIRLADSLIVAAAVEPE